MFKAALLALLLVPAALHAEVKSFGDLTGGLNTRNAGILLQDNESPALENVVLDKNGGVSRRDGYSEINASALGGGSSDVNAVYQLERSNGNKYCVGFSNTSGYVSSDGCETNSVFVSTLTAGHDVNCDAYGDKLYCVNDQYNFSFDGTNDAPMGGSPPSDLNYIRVFRDRCFGAGKDTNPSRLYWSNLGTCDTWTTSSDYVDIYAEDGDVITGIGTDLFNHLFVCKKFSSYLIQFDNLSTDNRKVIVISRNIGCKAHRGMVNFGGRQFFASTGHSGGQPGVYSTDGIVIDEDTKKLRGEIDTLSSFAANTGRETVDTKADWDAGVFDPYAMSSSRDQGFMQSSYTAYSPTTSTDWLQGTLIDVSTSELSGSLTIAQSTFTDDFNDNNFAAGLTTWTSTGWANSGDHATTATNGGQTMHSMQVNISSGYWTFDWTFDQTISPIFDICGQDGSNYCIDFRFVKRGNGDFYSVRTYPIGTGQQRIQLVKSVSGVETVLSATEITQSDEETKTIQVSRSAAGDMYVYHAGVFKSSATDTSVSGGPYYLEIYGNEHHPSGGRVYYQRIDNFQAYQYRSSGTWRSPIVDTYISTPIGGPFSSTFTAVAGEGSVNFFVRQSTSPNGDLWTDFAATSDTLRVPMNRRYQQIEARLFTSPAISTKTPHVDALSISAASTGTWRSPELYLSNAMTSWGLFRVDRTVTGSAASIAYDLRISTYQGGAASTGTVTVTPDGTISHSTGAYVIITATYTVFSASETAKDDVIALNWNEGAAAKSLVVGVYKNRLHFCGQSARGTINDVCYVRDQNGAWVRWTGVNARFLNVVGQDFMAAGSSTTGGGFIYKLYDTDSDNGSAIHSYYESKDHVLGAGIQNIKAVERFYLLGSNDSTTLTTTVKADAGSRSASYDISLSTGAPFKIIHKSLDRVLNGNTFRMRFENNAASKPWSIYGYGILFRDLGLMTP